MQRILLGLLALCVPLGAAAGPVVKGAGGQVPFGQPVKLEVELDGAPAYLPGTRFQPRGKNAFDVDVEFLRSAFGPFPPGVGTAVVSLGELAPGSYEVRTRAHDITSNAEPQVTSAMLHVSPPSPGIYTVPRVPQALSPTQVLLSSAMHFDASTLRVSMAPELVRVDFEFLPGAPATGFAPEGYRPYLAAPLPPLNPGRYRLEAWGTPKGGSGAQLYFSTEVTVQRTTNVVEFYSESLDHYFIAARAEDIEALDSGAYGGWKRTGQVFRAWSRSADAFPGARGVCRFYAPAHNSHFFTIDPAECDALRSDEQRGRAEAQSRKQSFAGWQFEGIAFYAMPAVEGACPAGTSRVSRAYNNRAAYNDANHRFTVDASQPLAVMSGWTDEGLAFCSPW